MPLEPGLEYLLCLARSERNPDMQGYAVRLAAFATNVFVVILIAWSDAGEPVTGPINAIMLQVFTILVASAISTIRRELSLADAHFAITITASPLAVYFLYASFRFLRRRPNYLYARLETPYRQRTTFVLSVFMLIWWIAFDCLIYFSRVFKTKDCPLTLKGFLAYRLFTSLLTVDFAATFMMPVPILFWFIYFARHFKDIRQEYRRHMDHTRPWRALRWIQTCGRFLKYSAVAQWDVITRSHQWLFTFVIIIAYFIWATSLLLSVPDTNIFWRQAAKILDPEVELDPIEPWNPYNYGQLLAAAVAIEPAWSVLKLVFSRRRDLWNWIKERPQAFWDKVVFIFTGRRNPWKTTLEKQQLDSLHYSYEGSFGTKSMDEVHLLGSQDGAGQRK